MRARSAGHHLAPATEVDHAHRRLRQSHVASGELGGALGVSLLALAAPLIAVAVVAVFCVFAILLLRWLFSRSRPRS